LLIGKTADSTRFTNTCIIYMLANPLLLFLQDIIINTEMFAHRMLISFIINSSGAGYSNDYVDHAN